MGDWRTTATPSNLPSVPRKLQERSQKTKRPTWMPPSRTLSPGWMPTQLPRRRNTKKSKRPWKELPCPFFNKWLVVPVACQEVCPEVCQVDPCLIWEELLEDMMMDTMIQPEAQPLKKSIKRHHFPSFSRTLLANFFRIVLLKL